MNLFSALKASLITALIATSLTASADSQHEGLQPQPGNRTVSVTLNQNLNHGDILQVRKLLNGLQPGDNVLSVDLMAQSRQQGAYLEIIVDNNVVGQLQLSSRLQPVSFPLNLRNGVDYQRLLVRSIGSSFVQTLYVQIGEQNPGEPLPPLPPPPPIYNPGPSLGGSCDDWDHTQFQAAKALAYSADGLDMTDQQATNWALNYNQTHACGTISEYKARFVALKNLAYSANGLNMSSQDAINYALSKVETVTSAEAQLMQTTLTAIKNFAYSAKGLDLSSQESETLGRQWLERGYCEDANGVKTIAAQYQREYRFAYSSNGLNYDSVRAKEYALSHIRNMSRCSDLFH